MPFPRVTRLVACAVLLGCIDHAAWVAAAELGAARWREDFHTQPPGWEVRRKPGVKVAEFTVEPASNDHDGALLMTAVAASGMFGIHLQNVDLRRTPILRWRWRAITLPTGADGRVHERDDQAIAIYVGTGGPLRQKSVAYRWETETPVGSEGDSSYAAG